MGGAASTCISLSRSIRSSAYQIANAKIEFDYQSPLVDIRRKSENSSFYNCVKIIFSESTLTKPATTSLLTSTRGDEEVVFSYGMVKPENLPSVMFEFEETHPWIKFEFEVRKMHLELVSTSWRSIISGTESFIAQETHTSPSAFFAAELYSAVFEKLPFAIELFSNNKPDLIGRSFVRMMSASIQMLTKPDNLLNYLLFLGDRHIFYGVKDFSSFGIFGECILRALKRCSGSEWIVASEDAWLQILSSFVLSMGSRFIINPENASKETDAGTTVKAC